MAVSIYDASAWPLLRMRWPRKVEADDVKVFIAEYDTYVKRREPFALVVDARDADMPSAMVRKALADYQRDHIELLTRYVRADATIVNSAIAKMVITAVNWFAPPAFPQQ